MKKIKKFQKINNYDYWMGLAMLLAAKSPNSYAAIIIENNNILSVGVSQSPPVSDLQNCLIPAETIAILNCRKDILNGTIVLTKTPDLSCAMTILAFSGLRKILYYPSEALDEKVKMAFSGLFGEIDEYKGNLNWIYDYLLYLDL